MNHLSNPQEYAMLRRSSVFLIILLSLSVQVIAGTTGKIAGKISDAETGEPLPGVNIILEGKSLGASSDIDGYFFILNIPPGEYTLSAMMVGYKTELVSGVIVSSDRTTGLDFSLRSEALLGDVITVTAERPMIQRDETAKAAVIGSETFAEMPVVDIEQVLTTQAGFSTDSEGEFHVRGGRAGEVAFMIDGVYVRDPYSGGFGSQIDKYSIEELQVLTGGFNAEYGQAMSGVINIVTKEGGSDYHGRLEYDSGRLNESPYRQKDWMVNSDIASGLSTTEQAKYYDAIRDTLGNSLYNVPIYSDKDADSYMLFQGNLTANLSGPVPGLADLKFFASASVRNDPGYLPWGYDKSREFNLKLTYNFDNLKLNVFGQRSYRDWKPYSHTWKYRPQGYEDRTSDVEREGIILTHTLSNTTFYEARLSRFKRVYDRFLPGKFAEFTFDPASNTYNLTSSNFVANNTNNDGFYINGDNGTIDYRDILSYTAKLDLTSQLSRDNLVKTGFELISHKISRETFILPWEGENHRYENFTRYPVELSLYAQDKLETDKFVLNLGLRYDYNDPRHTMWPDPDIPGYIDENGDWIASSEVKVKAKSLLSPRIGIGFPVTERTLFYGSYGHFYQIPSYLEMYGPKKVDEDQPLIGNPNIEPQKTVAFEAGVKQQISADYVVDLNIFFKDITNLAGSTYHGFFPYEYTLYDNSDYASVNGADLTITKKFSQNFSASLNYTYSVAKGNESDPREGYNDYKRTNYPLRPKRIFYLDFDRTHDMAFNLNYIFPKDFGLRIADVSLLENMQFNVLFEAASGLPYTPILDEGGEGLRVEKNTARQPATYNMDIKVLKPVTIASVRVTAFMVVTNVFDRRNPLNVWSRTGLPWDNGPYTSTSKDRVYNPTNVSEPRRISAGVRLDF
jgi:outer membrane receptor protein involved in Fe transport